VAESDELMRLSCSPTNDLFGVSRLPGFIMSSCIGSLHFLSPLGLRLFFKTLANLLVLLTVGLDPQRWSSLEAMTFITFATKFLSSYTLVKFFGTFSKLFRLLTSNTSLSALARDSITSCLPSRCSMLHTTVH